MKLLVFSDSHGNVSNMREIVEKEHPDRIFHLGDVARDARELGGLYPDIPMECVCGNCDIGSAAPNQIITDAGGRHIMLTHGHLYHVKLGVGAAVQAAREAKVDVLLFGHTHEALCAQYDDLWVMNPGTIRGGCRPSYGVILLNDGALTCHIMERNQGE